MSNREEVSSAHFSKIPKLQSPKFWLKKKEKAKGLCSFVKRNAWLKNNITLSRRSCLTAFSTQFSSDHHI